MQMGSKEKEIIRFVGLDSLFYLTLNDEKSLRNEEISSGACLDPGACLEPAWSLFGACLDPHWKYGT